MSVNNITDDELRAALFPYRVTPIDFEAAVRERMLVAEKWRAADPLIGLSPLAKAAAAMMPFEILNPGKMIVSISPIAPKGIGLTMFAVLTFPAVCMFTLLGATILSALKIGRIQRTNDPATFTESSEYQGMRAWWRRHYLGVILVFAANLYLAMSGATSSLFLIYVISLGLLIYVLSSLAKIGLGHRGAIAQSCGAALSFLGQTAGFPSVGDNEIHVVDPLLLSPLLFGGAFVVLFLGMRLRVRHPKLDKTPPWFFVVLVVEMSLTLLVGTAFRLTIVLVPIAAMFGAVAVLLFCTDMRATPHRSLINWARFYMTTGPLIAIVTIVFSTGMPPMFSAITPEQIKNYVETFEDRPDNTTTWEYWEIPARWAIDSNLHPDLSKSKRILSQEVDGTQNPYILGIMFHLGTISFEQLDQLREYPNRRRSLLDTPELQMNQPILSVEQMDWLIRTAAMKNDLTSAERDNLARRLILTIDSLSTDEYARLRIAVLVTELLDVIERPIDHERYRSQIHNLLRDAHSKTGGGFQLAGGFKRYLHSREPSLQTGALDSTSDALRLMSIYGIPEGLDLDWVRSYLRTKLFRQGQDKYLAPVLLDRLNKLPGVTHPSGIRVLYYERTLLAAMILVAMCIYATMTSPIPKIREQSV